MHLSLPVAYAAFCSKAVVLLLLLVYCSLLLQLFGGGSVFGPCVVMHDVVSFLVLQSS